LSASSGATALNQSRSTRRAAVLGSCAIASGRGTKKRALLYERGQKVSATRRQALPRGGVGERSAPARVSSRALSVLSPARSARAASSRPRGAGSDDGSEARKSTRENDASPQKRRFVRQLVGLGGKSFSFNRRDRRSPLFIAACARASPSYSS
jgi:hypothetical protein